MGKTCCTPAVKSNCNPRQSLIAGFLVAFILVVWYQRLPEHRKAFLKNFVRQIPELPGRYLA